MAVSLQIKGYLVNFSGSRLAAKTHYKYHILRVPMWIMHKILCSGENFFPAIVPKNVSHPIFKGSTTKKFSERQNVGNGRQK